ncbi:MAG: PorV/PorQ family protein [Bacteroidota bacterium]
MSFLFRTFLLAICFSNVVVSLSAQTPKYSNEFLTIGVSARAHGMSNAVVAHVGDVHAGFWNPAGLTQLQKPFQVAAMHAEWFAGIAKYDYLGIAKKLNDNPYKESTFGFSLVRLGVDNIPNTFYLVSPDGSVNYDNVTEFSAADYALLFSYAQKMKLSKLAIGGSAKIIRRVIGTFGNAWGFGIDLGTQYKSGNWRLGLMARDISFTFNGWRFNLNEEEQDVFLRTGNEIPTTTLEITTPRFIFGTAYVKKFQKGFSLIAEIDLDFTTDGERNVLISTSLLEIDPHAGVEINYEDLVFLRAGIGNIQKARDDLNPDNFIYTFQPNMGVGFHVGKFTLDYAFTDLGNVSQVLYSHIFSLKIDFEKRDPADDTVKNPKF